MMLLRRLCEEYFWENGHYGLYGVNGRRDKETYLRAKKIISSTLFEIISEIKKLAPSYLLLFRGCFFVFRKTPKIIE